MTLKEDMKGLVHAVVTDLALPYHVQNILEPQHPSGSWGISFSDPTAPTGQHVFEIAIGPVNETNLDPTKAELAEHLLKRQSER
jgi:hypothetical protein